MKPYKPKFVETRDEKEINIDTNQIIHHLLGHFLFNDSLKSKVKDMAKYIKSTYPPDEIWDAIEDFRTTTGNRPKYSRIVNAALKSVGETPSEWGMKESAVSRYKSLFEHYDNEEQEEEEEEEFEDKPEPEDIGIEDVRGGYSVGVFEGKHIGNFSEIEDANEAIRNYMKKNNFYPNVWFIDDHGGYEHHDYGFKKMGI